MTYKQKLIWRIIDTVVSFGVLLVVYLYAPLWVASLVYVYGVWAFVDGCVVTELY